MIEESCLWFVWRFLQKTQLCYRTQLCYGSFHNSWSGHSIVSQDSLNDASKEGSTDCEQVHRPWSWPNRIPECCVEVSAILIVPGDSVIHLFQNCSDRYWTLLHSFLRNPSSFVNSPGGRPATFLCSKKWFGVNASKSLMSSDTAQRGLAFRIASTSAKSVLNVNSIANQNLEMPLCWLQVSPILHSYGRRWGDEKPTLPLSVVAPFGFSPDSTHQWIPEFRGMPYKIRTIVRP
jgi:hypothetical protein